MQGKEPVQGNWDWSPCGLIAESVLLITALCCPLWPPQTINRSTPQAQMPFIKTPFPVFSDLYAHVGPEARADMPHFMELR